MVKVELSAAIIAELGQLFTEALRGNAAKLLTRDLDGIEQSLQEIARQVFGPVVEQIVAAIAQSYPHESPTCPKCHQPMRPIDYHRARQLVGLVGDYTLARAYFFCDACKVGRVPLDEHLGIGAGTLSPGLARVACRLGIDDSFEQATDAVLETLRVELPDEGVRRVTEGLGAVVEAEAQASIRLAQAGREPLAQSEVKAKSATILVEVDGAMVHEVDGDWHEVKSGLAAPLGPEVRVDKDKDKEGAREGGRPILVMGQPSYCCGLESAEAFWYRVYVEATRQGLGRPGVQRVVLLGDGAEWIWHYGTRFLAVEVGAKRVEVVEILDIFHAFEHLSTVANAVFGQDTPKAKRWLGRRKVQLESLGGRWVLRALGKLHPTDPKAADELRKAIEYFTEHVARMDYPSFLARQLPIASGAIESSCKTLIEHREKGAGMRWSESGAQQVASLRALHRSGRWQAFWKTHPQCRRPPVFPTKPANDKAA